MGKVDKKAAARKAKAAEAKAGAEVATLADTAMTAEQVRVARNRAVTGVLASEPSNRDVKFDSFSLMVGGNQLVNDCRIELNAGCRYGLIGDNGTGKSNVLAAIAQRDLPLPKHIDVFHLHEEAPTSDMTAVEAVISHIVEEAKRLEELSAQIMEESPDGAEDARLEALFERIDELDTTGAEPRARKILFGLGFSDANVPMDRKTKHMSGGWRMRVSLAQALFAQPSLLLLDEPTNHLDLEACVWLEQHLAAYPKCLLVISHSQDFLNTVCTHTVWLTDKQLRYYGGSYSAFVKAVADEEKVQLRQYEKQQADISKLEDFVRVNKANGVASSAKSKKKVLEKVVDDAVAKPKQRVQTLAFTFPSASRLAPPVMPFNEVCFGYSGCEALYQRLNFGIDCDSRVALVGPNGCGKSTLLKLMSGELSPTEGSVTTNPHCTLGLYHQHSTDQLDLDLSPLRFMQQKFPPDVLKRTEEVWRSYLSMFGFSQQQQQMEIGMLSEGQKARLVFALLAMKTCSLLLLDEPTNHLDTDAVDGLANAIQAFDGGVVLVSHDFRLIDKVATEIWVCENKGVRKFDGDIHEYRRQLAKKVSKFQV